MHLSLHVLVVLQCIVFRVFCPVLPSFSVFPLSPHLLLLLLLLLFISISVVLISSLNSQFSVMGALAGAGCGWVVGRAGLLGVLATWVRGWRLHSLGSTHDIRNLPPLFYSWSSAPKQPNHHWSASLLDFCASFSSLEVCLTERLTPWTPDLEDQGSILACWIDSLDMELYSTLSLFTQVY